MSGNSTVAATPSAAAAATAGNGTAPAPGAAAAPTTTTTTTTAGSGGSGGTLSGPPTELKHSSSVLATVSASSLFSKTGSISFGRRSSRSHTPLEFAQLRADENASTTTTTTTSTAQTAPSLAQTTSTTGSLLNMSAPASGAANAQATAQEHLTPEQQGRLLRSPPTIRRRLLSIADPNSALLPHERAGIAASTSGSGLAAAATATATASPAIAGSASVSGTAPSSVGMPLPNGSASTSAAGSAFGGSSAGDGSVEIKLWRRPRGLAQLRRRTVSVVDMLPAFPDVVSSASPTMRHALPAGAYASMVASNGARSESGLSPVTSSSSLASASSSTTTFSAPPAHPSPSQTRVKSAHYPLSSSHLPTITESTASLNVAAGADSAVASSIGNSTAADAAAASESVHGAHAGPGSSLSSSNSSLSSPREALSLTAIATDNIPPITQPDGASDPQAEEPAAQDDAPADRFVESSIPQRGKWRSLTSLSVMRVFMRNNPKFKLVGCDVNATTRQLCEMIAKKFGILSDSTNFRLYVQRDDMERCLQADEQPLLLQKEWLIDLGYREEDNLLQLGKYDFSHLFKFIFSDEESAREESSSLKNRVMKAFRALDTMEVPHLDLSSLDLGGFMQGTLPGEVETFLSLLADSLPSLSLAHNSLRTFPEEVSELVALKHLNLSNNLLRGLPASFAKLAQLTSLDASYNTLLSIPAPVCQLGRITSLNLTGNFLTSLPEALFSIVGLERLVLRQNRLTSLSGTLNHLTFLRHLDISSNNIDALPPNLQLPSLEELLIDRNAVSVLVVSWPCLTVLRASHNKISSVIFPCDLVDLRCIDLSFNKLSVLPDAFACSPLLRVLLLDHNKLRALPASIMGLDVLEALSVEFNRLTSLPEEWVPLRSLRHLSVLGNNLSALPDDIFRMESLRHLNAGSNVLQYLPSVAEMDESEEEMWLNAIDPSKMPAIEEIEFEAVNQTLQELYLGDNKLNDSCLPILSQLTDLTLLHLGYNALTEIPPKTLGRLSKLRSLCISGNDIVYLAEDVQHMSALEHLYISSNKLSNLPAELGKIRNLAIVDARDNNFKWNLWNQQFDWNWNWNRHLQHLDLSGNKRLVINDPKKDFVQLVNLKSLGLERVKVAQNLPEELAKIASVEQSVAKGVSSASSNVWRSGVAHLYGINSENFKIDTVRQYNFRDNADEALFAMFDGRGGSQVPEQLARRLPSLLKDQLIVTNSDVLRSLRGTCLGLNRLLGGQDFAQLAGSSGLILYISSNKLYLANVGHSMCVLCRNGRALVLSPVHLLSQSDEERHRTRLLGGFIGPDSRMNGLVSMSRAFGFSFLQPCINSSPDISTVELTDDDEFVMIGSKRLWEVVSPQAAVDIIRNEHTPSKAAQKLRDFAWLYGGRANLSVLVVFTPKATIKSTKRARRATNIDSQRILSRLGEEVAPPTGKLTLVCTDIKNSTMLWEACEEGMRDAVKNHNALMRRLLRLYSGYEVKTEGDAFMVSFEHAIDALRWCLTAQIQLLEMELPQEIRSACREENGPDGELLFRGISVRMGIYTGLPDCEPDPLTGRMDYFGPVVNRAAAVSSLADGGQVVISDSAWQEVSERLDELGEGLAPPRVDDLGLIKLKGLETKENVRLILPPSLRARTF
ncbi:hypothetical protein CAOG_04748 [Capsaspora owczarzaki ATCC 30864]|uniref:Adenylate cyclase n=1 Tax=Capsaspora owczarzaki (strain ATCC 30864) TaxID=595528 RepID=A0A0D2UG33_CAPO3|nr:hypothetical protein CAOG_04748 [Capsaspora owczarzaki ATCC 30864]KJE94051.1 hypothetical protein CAOG_004748 [Capsaspora owczarzaki ATCC 30864]|eukprot:XP_004347499.1 hypothetical protein CAOG_04748 [Capsaspora owczarzaki ATCC 30864]